MQQENHEHDAANDDGDSAANHDDDSTPQQTALHESSIMSDREEESINLLREIFPDESPEQLKKLHRERLVSSASKKQRPFTSQLGMRIWNLVKDEYNHEEPPTVTLPDDFLRLPIQQNTNKQQKEPPDQWREQLLQQLQQRVLRQHREYQETRGGESIAYPLDDEFCYTCALTRDATVGLGMTLCQEGGCIWVHSLLGSNGERWFRAPPPNTISESNGGPAIRAGIHPGDWVLGIQGEALLPTTTSHEQFLRRAVSSIQRADDPVVVHLQRVPFNGLHPLAGTGPSLLDTTMESVELSFTEELVSTTPNSHANGVTKTHPFIEALAHKGLIQNKKDVTKANKALTQYTERARHWESASLFRIDANTFELRPHFDPRDLKHNLNEISLPFLGDEADTIHSYARSTPTLDPNVDSIPMEYLGEGISEQQGLLGFQLDKQVHSPSPRKQTSASYPGRREAQPVLQSSDVFIPLMGVRKALCVRIVNTFLDDKRTAYTLWVYDVESGREWYAPVRYLSDFQELRLATGPLYRSIYQIPFPSSGWLVFGVNEASEPDSVRHSKCRQLENFLRTLCTLVYTDCLHPNIAEIAIHVQSFLGCDSGLSPRKDSFLHLQNQVVNNESMWGQRLEDGHTGVQMNVRLLLKRSIQRYVYRLFLLDAMKRVVDDFVSETRANGPTLKEIEALGAQGRDVLKARAMRDLGRIQGFLDQIQELVLEGCEADFQSIARRQDFYALSEFMDGSKDNAYLDKIVREAVREQIEIEIYVPLRSVVSRLLVNGWRHDDIEIHFKMNELRRRPQSMFKIPESEQSTSEWRSVSTILHDGVGRSTLPCAKLRAIVDAAKEIAFVYSREQEQKPDQDQKSTNGHGSVSQKSALGADDFLPIFIYSVVRADMERPCALCVLLQTLCDQSSRIGETGYYLASFESAITHIQELDLTLDKSPS